MQRNVPDHIQKQRNSIHDYMDRYFKYRTAAHLVGEFWDEEGCRSDQFGISGTSIAIALSDQYGFQASVLRQVKHVLKEALEKHPKTNGPIEQHLLKDVPRIPTKTVLLALVKESRPQFYAYMDYIFEEGLVDGMLKTVADDKSADGNVMVSAQVLHILCLSSESELLDRYKEPIRSLAQELKRQLLGEGIDLHWRLFISTTLCMVDYSSSISYHRKLVAELYSDTSEWHRHFSASSQYVDTWYSDNVGVPPRSRYFRLPISYIVLSAIYITKGLESSYFSFSIVRRMFKEITVPFDQHVGKDRNRCTAYYLFFTFVSLHPSKYFRVPKTNFLLRALDAVSYRFRNLKLAGYIVLTCSLLGLTGSAFYLKEMFDSSDWISLIPSFASMVGLSLAGVGLLKTTKR